MLSKWLLKFTRRLGVPTYFGSLPSEFKTSLMERRLLDVQDSSPSPFKVHGLHKNVAVAMNGKCDDDESVSAILIQTIK